MGSDASRGIHMATLRQRRNAAGSGAYEGSHVCCLSAAAEQLCVHVPLLRVAREISGPYWKIVRGKNIQ